MIATNEQAPPRKRKRTSTRWRKQSEINRWLDALPRKSCNLLFDLHAMRNEALYKQLLRGGANHDAFDAHGMTPLMIACLRGPKSAVFELLKAGAEPRHTNPQGHDALFILQRVFADGGGLDTGRFWDICGVLMFLTGRQFLLARTRQTLIQFFKVRLLCQQFDCNVESIDYQLWDFGDLRHKPDAEWRTKLIANLLESGKRILASWRK